VSLVFANFILKIEKAKNICEFSGATDQSAYRQPDFFGC